MSSFCGALPVNSSAAFTSAWCSSWHDAAAWARTVARSLLIPKNSPCEFRASENPSVQITSLSAAASAVVSTW